MADGGNNTKQELALSVCRCDIDSFSSLAIFQQQQQQKPKRYFCRSFQYFGEYGDGRRLRTGPPKMVTRRAGPSFSFSFLFFPFHSVERFFCFGRRHHHGHYRAAASRCVRLAAAGSSCAGRPRPFPRVLLLLLLLLFFTNN